MLLERSRNWSCVGACPNSTVPVAFFTGCEGKAGRLRSPGRADSIRRVCLLPSVDWREFAEGIALLETKRTCFENDRRTITFSLPIIVKTSDGLGFELIGRSAMRTRMFEKEWIPDQRGGDLRCQDSPLDDHEDSGIYDCYNTSALFFTLVSFLTYLHDVQYQTISKKVLERKRPTSCAVRTSSSDVTTIYN